MQKPVQPVWIDPPPEAQRTSRQATFAAEGERRTRYSLPTSLSSSSPVGYRTRISLTRDEATRSMPLLALERPTGFAERRPVTDGELFDECSLGILSARQSTNYRGHRQVTLGPEDSATVAALLRRVDGLEAPVLDGASHTHVVLSRPYRTPFTLLLTFIGHKPVVSLLTVPLRAWRKKVHHTDDIPTIGYLQQLHIGILADAMERAAPLASEGRRRAQVFQAPFTADGRRKNPQVEAELEALCGITAADRRAGWRICLVAQVGEGIDGERLDLDRELCRKLGANLLAFRSERIQPGVNQEEKAPEPYQGRQDMDVPDELTVQSGRAAYNAFHHWSGFDRERAKDLLLLERVDVLQPGGKQRLRDIRDQLGSITDQVVKRLPKWVDWPTGKFLSKNASRGRKAFALAGQRIYITGLSWPEIDRVGLDRELAVRAVGAAAGRGALFAELMGTTEIPEGCDLLGGICLMAGPVNQNDVGKTFYGEPDLLHPSFGDRDPTSLLVWTLKAKTVADPIGNEEQLLNPKRKGALVDLRPGPHDVVDLRRSGRIEPFRKRGDTVSEERAFSDLGNLVTDPSGRAIPGNAGAPWAGADAVLW